MNAQTLSVAFAVTSLLSASDLARAEKLEAQQKALSLITDTANKICNVVSARGEASSLEVKGNVTAEVRGLLSKLAQLGFTGTGAITGEQYEGVLRADLASTLKDNAACKLKVFETLQAKFLSSDTPAGSNVSGVWYDPNDPTSVAHITQNGNQVEFTKTGTLQSGIRYVMSGSGMFWGTTFRGQYQARYQNGLTSTGFCWGALPREGFETSTCKDTILGEYTTSMIHE